jgi:hypothetical protein
VDRKRWFKTTLRDVHPAPKCGGAYFTLTPGFNLALLEELDGLLVELFLAAGILTALEAFVLVVVDSSLHHTTLPREGPNTRRERGDGVANRARLTRGYSVQLVCRLQERNIPVRIW